MLKWCTGICSLAGENAFVPLSGLYFPVLSLEACVESRDSTDLMLYFIVSNFVLEPMSVMI